MPSGSTDGFAGVEQFHLPSKTTLRIPQVDLNHVFGISFHSINHHNTKGNPAMSKNNIHIAVAVAALFVSVLNVSIAGDIKGTIKAKGAKHNGDAVIYIDTIAGKKFNPPKEHAKMDQKNLAFSPRVLPVLVGTTVDFLNSDDVLHNVFTPDKCADKFNLGTWPKGQVRSFTFKTLGCSAAILCNVHPEMEAYVVTVGTPYFSVSEKDGSYTLKNVPAGKYTLQVWHEKLKGSPVTVEVPEKGEVTANFQLKK
jgi:plastocyanin